jgi:hypothetical protein
MEEVTLMGRYYLSQFEERLQPLGEGVEVLLAEADNALPLRVDLPPEGFRAALVVINLSTKAEARVGLRRLQRSGSFLQGTIFLVRPERLANTFRSVLGRPVDFATVIIFVDEATNFTWSQLQQVVDSATDEGWSDSTRLLAVCPFEKGWNATGIDGFVRGCDRTDVNCALTLFAMMAVEMAPVTQACLDFGDFPFERDRPETAAVLVQASWSKGARRLRFANAKEREVVAGSACVFAVPFLGQARLEDVRDVSGAIRNSLNADARFEYGAAEESIPPLIFMATGESFRCFARHIPG